MWWEEAPWWFVSLHNPVWATLRWLLCEWVPLGLFWFLHSSEAGSLAGMLKLVAYVISLWPKFRLLNELATMDCQVLLCMSMELCETHVDFLKSSKYCKAWSIFLGHSSHRFRNSSLHICPFLKYLYYLFPNVLNQFWSLDSVKSQENVSLIKSIGEDDKIITSTWTILCLICCICF
jgi:hypothetical protein